MENELDYVKRVLEEKEKLSTLTEKQREKELDNMAFRRKIILGDEYTTYPFYMGQTVLYMEKDKGVFELLTGRKMTEAEFFIFCEQSEKMKDLKKSWGIKDFIISVEQRGEPVNG